MAARKKKKIVFVCTGNTCRSPMAQLLLAKYLSEQKLKGYDVRSAGTAAKKGDTINPKSAQVLSENAIVCESFSSTKLTEKLLLDAFAVVCMTEKQREYLMDMRWNALKKAGKSLDEAENNVYSFAEITGYEILDPYGKDIDCYRYVYGLLAAGMPSLLEKLDLKNNAWETPVRTKKTVAKRTQSKTPSKTKTKKTPPITDENQGSADENKQLSIF
ncbi:MAG: hypothetical protein J6C79_02910 [Clostridia bacterium]|nr:hypothetical protein [Clostridia bacterium]